MNVCEQTPRLPPFEVRSVIAALAETVDWGLALFGVPATWQQSRGAGIKVAVLDTGVALEHPDLVDAIDAARDFTGNRRGAEDGNGHGTHCAGVIAARQNQVGVIGVAPECRLLVGRVLDDRGAGDGAWVAAGIDWAAAAGTNVISMSLGAPAPDERIGAAIERAVAAGTFVICAAGNTGRADDVNYPARWKGRPRPARDNIAVAAVDRHGRVARFSSRGPEVDIAAPGVDVLSTFLDGGYAAMSGTSMATPFVAGIVALVLARHRSGKTSATPLRTIAELREHLQRTARDAGTAGKDPEYGYGLIDPATMLRAAAQDDDRAPLIELGSFRLYVPARTGDLLSIG